MNDKEYSMHNKWIFATALFAMPRLGTFVNGDKGLVVQANINLGGSINPVGFKLLFPVGQPASDSGDRKNRRKQIRRNPKAAIN